MGDVFSKMSLDEIEGKAKAGTPPPPAAQSTIRNCPSFHGGKGEEKNSGGPAFVPDHPFHLASVSWFHSSGPGHSMSGSPTTIGNLLFDRYSEVSPARSRPINAGKAAMVSIRDV